MLFYLVAHVQASLQWTQRQ